MALKNIFFVLFVVCAIGLTFARVPRHPEETSSSTSSTTAKTLRFCDRNEPCGWTVYQKNIRKDIDYYLDNACICPPPKKCERTNDDISIYAYVHRCVPLEPEKSILDD